MPDPQHRMGGLVVAAVSAGSLLFGLMQLYRVSNYWSAWHQAAPQIAFWELWLGLLPVVMGGGGLWLVWWAIRTSRQ